VPATDVGARNAKRALYLGADANLQAAFEIENMAWTEVMQSDDAQLALKTFIAVDPDSRARLVRVENSKKLPNLRWPLRRFTMPLATFQQDDHLGEIVIDSPPQNLYSAQLLADLRAAVDEAAAATSALY